MIDVLYSRKDIMYRVVKGLDEDIKYFDNIDDAIEYDCALPPDVHYSIMDGLSDLEFMGSLLPKCKSRFCNGCYAMFEYESSDGVCWIVTTMEKRVMAVFALREQAMKYIHDKERRT